MNAIKIGKSIDYFIIAQIIMSGLLYQFKYDTVIVLAPFYIPNLALAAGMWIVWGLELIAAAMKWRW